MGGALGSHCRLLGAVAVEDVGQHVHGGLGVRGSRCQDAMRVGFGGAEVDVVGQLASGDGHVQLLHAQRDGAHDVAAVGGQALGAVDGGGVSERQVGGDVVRWQVHEAARFDVAGFDAAVAPHPQYFPAVAVAHEVGSGHGKPAGVLAGADDVAGRCAQSVGEFGFAAGFLAGFA
ncbi:Uncharacterised protein [Mycobacteroides abscessus subsp. abscessus]|nr:Uncharacterised protein [Mycobacteroides abscessus subsp. abscessus]SKW97037.1 Uncharacterised protein [Mycobacteroides abscessus subsp. abscessus]